VKVAGLFGISPVRVCQIVSRVRQWVDEEIGDWLFPRCDDLRFYAALASVDIRVQEVEGEPEAVLLVGPGWSYSRQPGPQVASIEPNAPLAEGSQASSHGSHRSIGSHGSDGPNQPLPLSAAPLNLPAGAAAEPVAARSSQPTDSIPEPIEQLGRRLAELLMVWKKTRRLSGAIKAWR
jgi:hypothetical protein